MVCANGLPVRDPVVASHSVRTSAVPSRFAGEMGVAQNNLRCRTGTPIAVQGSTMALLGSCTLQGPQA